MRLDSTIRSNPTVAYRDLEEGGVLLHLRSGQYHKINATGRTIWMSIAGELTVGELIERVRDQIPDAPPQLGMELQEFLTGLLERDLVEFVE